MVKMAKKVEIYSTPTCNYCHIAKDFFNKNNIKYIDYNVGEDDIKKEEMIEKSGQMKVPVIVIDKKVFVGFDQKDVSKELGLNKVKVKKIIKKVKKVKKVKK